jgi:hypothetical protein
MLIAALLGEIGIFALIGLLQLCSYAAMQLCSYACMPFFLSF